MSKPEKVQLGRTTIPLSDLVEDPRGCEEMLVEIITQDWNENHYLTFGATLRPFARAADLAHWNQFLLERYKPLYLSAGHTCRDCSRGPCDLALSAGPCGRPLPVFKSLHSLRLACRGTLSQLVISRQLLDFALKSRGADTPVSMGKNITFADAAPSIALLTGLPVKTLADLDKAQSYAEQQLGELMTAALNGQGDAAGLEAMAFHAGSLLLIAMEVAEIIKVACFEFPSAGNLPMEELEDFPPASTLCGLGALDREKPALVFTGDDFLPAWTAVHHLQKENLTGQIEVGGIGAVGCDLARFYPAARVLTTAPRVMKVIKAGLADVLVITEGCRAVNADIVSAAQRIGTKVISTSRSQTFGLHDRTGAEISSIVAELLSGAPGVVIFDAGKAGVVAGEVARRFKRLFSSLGADSLMSHWAAKCMASTTCLDACFNACPYNLDIRRAVKESAVGDVSPLARLFTACDFCGRCEDACPEGVPIENLLVQSAGEEIREDKAVMRPGRGPVPEVEIRAQAFGLTFGNCPGIVAVIGCGTGGMKNEAAYIAKELVSINCVVFTAGCLTLDIAKSFDEKRRQFIFQQFGSAALARSLVNCGSCTAQVHIVDEFMKVARLGGAVSHYANLMEAADYVYNRVFYSVILWGLPLDRMYALAAGYAQRGIPVIAGPASGLDFPRFLAGDKHDRRKWIDYHGAIGIKREVEPAPHHLLIPAENKEEAIIMAVKLLMRSSEQRESRLSSLEAYINFHQKFFGELPDDWVLYVRSDQELPVRTRIKLLNLLRDRYGWEIENYRIKKARTRDGKLVPIEEYTDHYGIEQAGYATCLADFVQRRKREGS